MCILYILLLYHIFWYISSAFSKKRKAESTAFPLKFGLVTTSTYFYVFPSTFYNSLINFSAFAIADIVIDFAGPPITFRSFTQVSIDTAS